LSAPEQRLGGRCPLGGGLLDLPCHRRRLGVDHRGEQGLLVGEVVIQRPARHASPRNDLGRTDFAIGPFGEQGPPRLDQRRPRRLGSIPIRPSCRLFLHTCSLYVISLITYILYVCSQRKESAMRPSSFYPVVMTDDVAASSAFFLDHFGFRTLFTSDWYVHLQSEANPAFNFAVPDKSHATIPAAYRDRTGGVLLSFEVEDVDAEYARLKQADANI